MAGLDKSLITLTEKTRFTVSLWKFHKIRKQGEKSGL